MWEGDIKMPKARLLIEIEAPQNVPAHEWTPFVRALNELVDELREFTTEAKAKGYKITCEAEPFMSLGDPTSGPPW